MTLQKRWKGLLRSKPFLISIFILGLLILIYPLISDRYYSIKQDNAVSAYKKTVKQWEEEGRLKKIREQALVYNSDFYQAGGTSLFDGARYQYALKAFQDGELPEFYKTSAAIGFIRIPKINMELPIYYGTDDSVLEKGIGYMPLTSLPVGGSGTHTILTGHRGLPQSRLFRDLDELKSGDLFLVESLGETMAYQVDDKQIIAPTNFEVFHIEAGKEMCTLLTCHPYMINSERLIVTGHRVPYTPEVKKAMEEQEHTNRLRLFLLQYMEYIIGIGIFILLVLIRSLLERRRLKKLAGGHVEDPSATERGHDELNGEDTYDR